MSASNPYLAISRVWNVSYTDVLCFADAYKKQFKNLNYWEQKAKRIQGSTAAQAIIAHIKGTNAVIFYSAVIQNNGAMLSYAFPQYPIIKRNGSEYYVSEGRWVFEGMGGIITRVELCWNCFGELVLRSGTPEVKQSVRLIDSVTEKFSYVGDLGLWLL